MTIDYDMLEAAYHASPGLSASGMKLLLDCPARYRWEMDHPVVKDVYDFGSIVHRLVLNSGPDIVPVDADSWRTKAAKH